MVPLQRLRFTFSSLKRHIESQSTLHHREIETVKNVLHGKGTARAPRHGKTTARHATKLYPAPSEMGGRAGKYKSQEVATNKRRQRTQTAGSGKYRVGRPTRRFSAWWEGKAEATLAEATVGVAAEGRERGQTAM